MTKDEAIKYLQQIYPNGGHCWLDEQRIEAIGMAVNALQKEPVSEDLEEASKEWLRPQLDKSYADYGETKMMELTRFDGYAMLDAIEFGAKWKEEQMTKKAINATIEAELDSHGADYGIQKIECAFGELEAKKLKNGAKVKLVIVK